MSALGTFIAGQFTGTLGGSSLGILEDGWRLRWQWLKEMIDRTDAYGDSPIDAIQRGVSVNISGIFKETLAKVITAVSPYNSYAPTGSSAFAHPTVGVLDTSLVATLVLTAVAGTPAASTPTSLTAAGAIQSTDAVDQLWGPTLRKTPFNFQLYPYLSSTVKLFTTTAFMFVSLLCLTAGIGT